MLLIDSLTITAYLYTHPELNSGYAWIFRERIFSDRADIKFGDYILTTVTALKDVFGSIDNVPEGAIVGDMDLYNKLSKEDRIRTPRHDLYEEERKRYAETYVPVKGEMTVKQFMKMPYPDFGQFYSGFSTKEGMSVEDRVNQFLETLREDIKRELNARGRKVSEKSIAEECESIRPFMTRFVKMFEKRGFDYRKINNDDLEFAFGKKVGFEYEVYSKNGLLYTRPCEIFTSKDRISFEFND